MNRRELLGQTTLAVGALAASSVSGMSLAATTAKGRGLVATASHCINVGEECLTHCFEILSKGDKSMAECAATVRDMLAACRGLVSIASADSKHLKDYAAVCAKICWDCEAACKKHANHHDVCKRCMEACAECAKACEAA